MGHDSIMTDFTPLAGTIGGILIGLSAVLLMATAGRIAGLSGIFGGLFTSRTVEEWAWRALFTAGLLAGAAIAGLSGAFDVATIAITDRPMLLVASGLLVGAGTVLGAGCTSGHGICGLSRLSLRSLVSTLVFMGVAIATVFVVRHVTGVGA
jgi:uncharacterized membrane protein YedE/YeeE